MSSACSSVPGAYFLTISGVASGIFIFCLLFVGAILAGEASLNSYSPTPEPTMIHSESFGAVFTIDPGRSFLNLNEYGISPRFLILSNFRESLAFASSSLLNETRVELFL